MKVTLERKNDAYWFHGTGKNPVPIPVDNGENGASPMELLLMSVGGCSAVDIVTILTKQKQEITSYKIEVTGERKEVAQAKPFAAMHVNIYLDGKIIPARAKKAADLSFQKYCSVSLTLEPQVPITYDVHVNGEKID
ncbi:MAG: disulfide bond formation regulator [Flavobacteriaceae bacterium]|nr:disulfide bond formation regulator [Flavobacteriaceae bacterium]|tara:strand:+ start:133 stop:543 length:411 start_codon:yes stop_codon:yes gene_type:complete